MKTKDGRSVYGSGRKCDCGNKAMIRYCGAWICDRCARIQKALFKDEKYCGEWSPETKAEIREASVRGGESVSEKKVKASRANVEIAWKTRWGYT